MAIIMISQFYVSLPKLLVDAIFMKKGRESSVLCVMCMGMPFLSTFVRVKVFFGLAVRTFRLTLFYLLFKKFLLI